MQTVGYIVGEVNTNAFTFVTNREIAPPRLEYIVVQVQEPNRTIDVLAQVTSLSVSSRLLGDSLGYAEVEAILNRLKSSPPIVQGQAQVLGYLEGNAVRFPRHAAVPGATVTMAPDELLRKFFSGIESGIEIGTLINRPNVSVQLNPNGLRRHMAVIAQTGAGKSYTVGVVLEKLLKLGGTVVVFDPNSDYVLMRRDAKRNPTSFADRVEVYRLPTTQAGRIPDEEIGGAKKFTIQFSKLEVDEICQMTGIAPTSTNIRKAIQTVWDKLQGSDYTPKQFRLELEELANGADVMMQQGPPARGMSRGPRVINPAIGDEAEFDRMFKDRVAEKANVDEDWFDKQAPKSLDQESPENGAKAAKEPKQLKDARMPSMDAMTGAQKAIKYVELLERVDIWGFQDVPMRDLIRPMTLSVLDVAGVDQWISEFIVTKVLNETWGIAVNEGLPRPVFFVLEEAHNFVPGGTGTQSHSAAIIKRISSEGRKFGLFLVLITQRPYKVHPDTLSQCNSQIIMRLTNPQDQQAIRLSSESISEGLLADLPGLNIGEAVILGPLVRVPVMVKVGHRESQEGGNDIDVVAALERARSEVITDVREQKSKEEKKARGRSEWKEAV